MKMVIYTDLHIFGAHKPIKTPLMYGPDIFYIGDNVDLKNCPHSKVSDAQNLVQVIETHAGRNYLPGNHELSFGRKLYLQYHRVLLTHGDVFFWPKNRMAHWRGGSMQPGISKSLWWILRIKNAMVKMWPVRISPMVHKRMYDIATSTEYQCHTVIIGHAHPQRTIRKTYSEKGSPTVDLYVLPRGRHELDIEVH